MKYIFSSFVAACFALTTFAQTSDGYTLQRPKLVVGIVVDQMRWDYLYKFYPLYSETGGFKRLLGKGFTCDNTLIPYTPTVTAAGHTCVYTGSVPAVNGIVGNVWFDKSKNRVVYCADDDTAKTIGANDDAGRMSPANLAVTTVTDELRLATNFSSKVIGLSIKDRGAIFPAGHLANAAYWYDPENGNIISSSYYMTALPAWVNNFNKRSLVDSFYSLNWNVSLPANVYQQYCGNDDQPYERKPFGTNQKVFPYTLSSFVKKDYSKIAVTPHGNSLLELLAETTITSENLGKNDATDFLTVSFSSPDYIGHTFGSESWEQLDNYIKLDSVFARFLSFLDKQVGTGNYLVFLTADHAVANSPGYAQQHRMPGGTFNENSFVNALRQLMLVKFKSDKIIKGLYEDQLLLNYEIIDSLGVDRNLVETTIVEYAEKAPGIARAFSLQNVSSTTLTEVQKKMYSNSYFPQRSGTCNGMSHFRCYTGC